MKALPSQKAVIYFTLILILVSPVANLWLQTGSPTSSSYKVNQTSTTNSVTTTQSPSKAVPDSFSKIYAHDDGRQKILTFDSFTTRDQALKILPKVSLLHVYKYIPSMVVTGVVLQDYQLSGLVSAMNDIKLQSQQSNIVDLRVKNAYTLYDTAQMTGIDHLRDDLGLKGEGIKIAVLDTGVNSSLESFDHHVSNYVVSGLASKGSLDQDGHGTHVAGIISSDGEYYLNGKWTQTNAIGMAPDATVYSIRVLDETGSGDNSWIIEGIEKAMDLGVNIISMSLSTVIYEGPNDPMAAIVKEAYNRGIILVAAAGNTGPIGSGIGIPGALDDVIAVGASYPRSSSELELWSYSAIGPSLNGPGPDVIAPGAKIISISAKDGNYAQLSGTSMSTPHVSGGIALLKEAFPDATQEQIRQAILASAQISFNENGQIDYIEGQGRGEVRFDIAYVILNYILNTNPSGQLEMPLYPNIVQDRNFVYHNRIVGQNKTLPFYIYSSRNLTVFPVVNATATEGVAFYFPDSINLVPGKNRINITLEVTATQVEHAKGELFFVDNASKSILPNSYLFYDTETRYREANILFDTSHDNDTKSAYFGNHGPMGQFSQMSQRLEAHGQVIHMSHRQEITPELLAPFDMLVIANPDLAYSTSEIAAIQNFVEVQGKSMMIIVSGGLLEAENTPTYPAYNLAGLNAILKNSGISINNDNPGSYDIGTCDFVHTSYEQRLADCIHTATMLNDQSIFTTGQSFPHYGPSLTLSTSTAMNKAIAYSNYKSKDYTVAASAEFPSNGRIMVFSSQLPFDNTGILYDYFKNSDGSGNEQVLLKTTDWLIQPRQVKIEVDVNGVNGTEFKQDMYTSFYFLLSASLYNGTGINYGGTIDLNLKITQSGYRPGYQMFKIGQQNGDYTYGSAIDGGNTKNQLWEFYYHFTYNGSISSDGYFSIYFQLKNFDRQPEYRKVALSLLTLIMISWLLWLSNEGGRLRWLKKQQENKE